MPLRTFLLFVAFIVSFGPAALAEDVGDCIDCDGGELGRNVEISEMYVIVFCNSHKTGRFRLAREYGAKLFGSLEAFYKNLHRVQCPPFYPSPLYHSVQEQGFDRGLITELENIGKFLTLEERQRLLNRPDEGRRKLTVLNMADISLHIAKRSNNTEAMAKYDKIRKMLIELGAKRDDEMTPEELSRYQ